MHLPSALSEPLLRLCTLFLIVAAPGTSAEFHVSPSGNDAHAGTAGAPFATLERARDAIRTLKAGQELKEPVTVWLAPGTHVRTQPFQLTPQDSGTATAPITYRSQRGAVATISGGREITGWRRHDERLWVAEIAAVKRGEWRFRQLWVDGAKRPRARNPDNGFHVVAGFPEGTSKTVHYHTDCQSFEFAPGDIRADWTNLEDVEVVVYHFWTDSHLPIQSVDADRRIVTFRHKAGKVFTDDFTENGARYIVENVFEGLTTPGEWYLNRRTGQLFYFPLPGEDPTRVTITAPVAPALIRLSGDLAARRFVEHVSFEDLQFVYTHFELPAGNSNDRQGSASVTAAVRIEGARDVTFAQNRFARLGTFAIDVLTGCERVQIVGNEITHTAAGGIRVGGGKEIDPPWHRTRDIVVTDNWLHHYGEDFPSAVGLMVMNAESVLVAHNRIHDGSYTGISVGWNWGYTRSVSQQNRIEFNHVSRIGLRGLLSDMGGVYTLGVSPGTVVRNNHIHDVSANRYGGWGIYNDEGTSNLLVENNVVHRTKFAAYNIHFAREVTVRNNIFALGQLEQMSRSRAEPHHSVFFENNIIYWREGELFAKNWNEAPYAFRQVAIRPPVQETSNFSADWNLYFNPTLSREQVVFAQVRDWDSSLYDAQPKQPPGPPRPLHWADWQARGKDTHSRYADPLFRNPEADDFTLAPDSPAFALGFRAIDLSRVGPRVTPGPR